MENLIKIKNKSSCCGCGACLNVCPKNAITMKLDKVGNYYPYIDKNKCINCGLCKRICLFSNYNKSREERKCYAAYSKLNNLLSNSSSGGIFSSIAHSFLKQGGYVCGCASYYENSQIKISHIIIDNEKDLEKLQGSKYVQSNMVEIFPEVKRLLIDNKKVLFSGTPCQIVGLKSYLNKDYENLYTIDIICHGAPSQKLFYDYISFVEKNKKVKITNFKFRDKLNGWALYGYLYGKHKKNNKPFKSIFSNNESSYYYLFQKGYLYRENCYSCPYASSNRPGDITLGDYWGIELEHPELVEKAPKGISCLIINNLKGENLIENYGNDIEKVNSTFEKIQRNNSQLQHPTIEPDNNKQLLAIYEKYGYKAVEKEFVKIIGFKNLYINKLKNRVKKYIQK